MKFVVCILGSGSKGNSIYVETDRVSLLIDAGFSAKEITKRLESAGLSPDKLQALLITHEHQDHIKGLGPVCRKFDLDLYLTPETMPEKEKGKIKKVNFISPGREFKIGGLTVLPFSLPHDARNPVGYRLEVGGKSVVVATDFGHPTPLIKERIKGSDVIIIEANHNERMLREGSYPWELKQRIKSNYGHISNSVCGKLLLESINKEVRRVYLSHISEENNTYKKAYTEVGKFLTKKFSLDKIKDFLKIARQEVPTKPLEI